MACLLHPGVEQEGIYRSDESFCAFSESWCFDLVEHAPRPEADRYRLSDRPGLGVGAFQVEAAKALPFDPKAFLPWSEDRRERF